MGPKSNKKYPYKTHTRETQRRGGSVTTGAEIGVKSPQVKAQETGRRKEWILP